MIAASMVYFCDGVGEVALRSGAGEGRAAGVTLTLVASRLDLSRAERERCTDAGGLM